MYLLSSQSLYDIVSGNTAILRWAGNVPDGDVSISIASVARVWQTIHVEASIYNRHALEAALRSALAPFQANDRIYPVNRRVAERWALLGNNGSVDPAGGAVDSVSEMERLVVATALVGGLRLVGRHAHYRAAFPQLSMVDPY